MVAEYRLYGELAGWWPLISPPEEYVEEGTYLAEMFAGVSEVLDLGSGGGHVAAQLKGKLNLTLVDLSEDMLSVSRQLNPECVHVRGDMRTIRLGRTFDAVLAHDGIDYMTSENDLRQAIETAFAHCRPGGMAVFVPDYIAEEFVAANGGGGGRDGTGRQASFREWTWDPDPADDWIQVEYEFTLHAEDGTAQVVHESHRLGAFGRDTWLRLLAEAGFEALATDVPAGARGYVFTGRRPPAG